eukprot:TRINITY_DN19072_c0_g1_i1.p4 TRINITY_DN19072_c0_g1~~TRINITY_DN19072_c0_g1_i1.p4  ORF type:complete len:118 (+),score=5.37 TRINITY_DN19072_c0_g1_i1:50-403(+)
MSYFFVFFFFSIFLFFCFFFQVFQSFFLFFFFLGESPAGGVRGFQGGQFREGERWPPRLLGFSACVQFTGASPQAQVTDCNSWYLNVQRVPGMRLAYSIAPCCLLYKLTVFNKRSEP